MDGKIDIQILDTPLSLDECYDFATDPLCGSILLFVGTVRNHNKGKDVLYLDFETYKPMALKEMETIAKECQDQYQIHNIAIHHREGKVNILSKAVVIAVSSVHREEGFQACKYAIDNLKSRVPIWKKEFLLNGSYWVNSRP